MSKHLMGWSLRRVVPVVLALAAAAACGPFHRGSGELPASILFTNDALDQATMYVVGPGQDLRRIGTVFSGRTDTLIVPPEFVGRGTLNIVARLLARSELPQTGPVSIRPGECYQVTLTPDAKLLTFLPAAP